MNNRAILNLARGRECLLRIPGVCSRNPETTVACHKNGIGKGLRKGIGIKNQDFLSVWGCSSCHMWLDQGMADRKVKDQAFAVALARQEQAWLHICETGRPKERETAAQALKDLWRWYQDIKELCK